MSTPTLLTDALIARRLEERTTIVDPGLVAEILRATDVHPQRRSSLHRALSTAWVLLVLALLLAAVATMAILNAPPPMPPGLSVTVGSPMGGLWLSPDGRWGLPMRPGGHGVVSTDPRAPLDAKGLSTSLFTLKGAGGAAVWSTDSRFLAWWGTSSPAVVTIYDLEQPSHEPRTLSLAATDVPPTAPAGGMLWSADGSQILLQTSNCPDDCTLPGSILELYLLDVRTGSVQVVSRSLPPGVVAGWSPDGKQLGFTGGLIIDLDGNTIRDLLPAVSDRPPFVYRQCGWPGPAWSPDGSRIAIIDPLAQDTGRLLVFDPGAARARVLAADACAITGWAPDGARIVFVSGDSFATRWVQEGNGGGRRPTGPGSDAWIVPVDGGQPELIRHLGWGEIPILTWAAPAG